MVADAQGPEGIPFPDFTNPGAILGWMICLAFLLAFLKGGGAVSRVGRRLGGPPAEESQTVSVLSADGREQKHELRDPDPALKAAIEDMAATARDTTLELRAQRREIAQIREHAERQDAKISTLTGIVTRLRAKVVPLVGWIDAGAEPPAPLIDDELRDLLRERD